MSQREDQQKRASRSLRGRWVLVIAIVVGLAIVILQRLAAGADGVFGAGGQWSPESAAQDAGEQGKDDLSNFHIDFLGRRGS